MALGDTAGEVQEVLIGVGEKLVKALEELETVGELSQVEAYTIPMLRDLLGEEYGGNRYQSGSIERLINEAARLEDAS